MLIYCQLNAEYVRKGMEIIKKIVSMVVRTNLINYVKRNKIIYTNTSNDEKEKVKNTPVVYDNQDE